MVKKLTGFTIKIKGNSATIIPEKDTPPWHRECFDRKKDGLICPEILRDMQKIAMNLSISNEKGQRVGKYKLLFGKTLSANPTSSQGKRRASYKEMLIEELKKSEKKTVELAKFKDMEEVLVYVAVYLRKERYKKVDIDNHIKTVIDALKTFIGDDNKVVTLIAEKKMLDDYPPEDMDFLEQTLN